MNQNEQDYQEELQFVKDFIKHKVLITDYPYHESYRKTLSKEYTHLHGKLLVIGSGPLPLSMYMVGGFVDGLDCSEEAVDYGKRFLKKAHGVDFSIYCERAELFSSYEKYDSILLTLEAGAKEDSKRLILDKLPHNMKQGATLLVRSSNTEGDFVNATHLLESLEGFTLVDKLSVFDGLSTSFVLTKV